MEFPGSGSILTSLRIRLVPRASEFKLQKDMSLRFSASLPIAGILALAAWNAPAADPAKSDAAPLPTQSKPAPVAQDTGSDAAKTAKAERPLSDSATRRLPGRRRNHPDRHRFHPSGRGRPGAAGLGPIQEAIRIHRLSHPAIGDLSRRTGAGAGGQAGHLSHQGAVAVHAQRECHRPHHQPHQPWRARSGLDLSHHQSGPGHRFLYRPHLPAPVHLRPSHGAARRLRQLLRQRGLEDSAATSTPKRSWEPDSAPKRR